jgi:UDP-glucose 4-epimerase
VGEIYNIGSGHTVSIQHLLDQLLDLSSTQITVDVSSRNLRPVDAPVLVAQNDKITALGWSPLIPLAETLRDVLSYWRDIIKTAS